MRWLRVALTVAIVLAGAGIDPRAHAGQSAIPSPDQILRRVLAASTQTPKGATADAVFKLRLKKSVTESPDCVFSGTMRLDRGRESFQVGQRTAGLVCWAVNQYVLGRVFGSQEPFATLLGQFDFHVIGEKMADGRRHYLLRGSAKDPHNNIRSLIGWIDYERGLVTDSTIDYAWGSIDTRQSYARIRGAWLPASQYLYAPRYDASLEISYSNFRFTSP